jgi:hypothetical protein
VEAITPVSKANRENTMADLQDFLARDPGVFAAVVAAVEPGHGRQGSGKLQKLPLLVSQGTVGIGAQICLRFNLYKKLDNFLDTNYFKQALTYID